MKKRLGLGLGAAVVVVMATTGCTLLKKSGSDAGAGDAAVADAATATTVAPVDAAVPVPVVDAAASATPSAKTAAPARSGALAGKGDCSCLPDQGNLHHGNNMRLAPTFRTPSCSCRSSGTSICMTPIKTCKERGTACNESFGDLCKGKVGIKGAAGGTCQGWNSIGERGTGQLDCQFESDVDTYPRPAGATCTGFTVDNKSVKGHVFCR